MFLAIFLLIGQPLSKIFLTPKLTFSENDTQVKNFKTEENFLTYDVLCKYLINRKVKQLVETLQRFLSALTINSAARGEKNVSYDDMAYSCREVFPLASEAWIYRIYKQLVDTPQAKGITLEKMVDSTLSSIIRSDIVLVSIGLSLNKSDSFRTHLLKVSLVQRRRRLEKCS